MKTEFYDAMRVLRPVDKRAILALAVLGAGSVLLEIVGLLAVSPLMSFLASPDAAERHVSVRVVESVFQPRSPTMTLLLLFMILIGVYALKSIYTAVIHFLNFRAARAGGLWMSRKLFELYLYRSVEQERIHGSVDAVRNIKETGQILYFTIMINFVNFVTEVFVVLGIGVLLLWLQPLAALAAGLLMSLGIALQYYLFGHKVRALGERVTSISRESYKQVLQALAAHKEIRLRGKESYFIDRLLAEQAEEISNRKGQLLLYAVAAQVNEVFMLVVIAIVIAVIIVRSEYVFEAFSVIAIFAAAALRLMPTINRLVHATGELHTRSPDISILRQELDKYEREIPEQIAQRTNSPATLNGELRLTQVNYHYPDRIAPALENVDLAIRRGEFVGIAGPSGAGKSTLTDILMALVPPTSGRFEIDGQDVWSNPCGVRALIGYVPQSVYLMDDSVRRNIAFGEPDSLIDEVRVSQSIEIAQLAEFLRRQPNGLDARLGERGAAISGGERQRIGIARALYHEPQILVLDEVTSQLDTETEHALSKTLSALKGDKTIIVIAHRLSTVKNCDRVVFMNEGKIVDAAPFHILAGRNADFARMVTLANVGLLPERA